MMLTRTSVFLGAWLVGWWLAGPVAAQGELVDEWVSRAEDAFARGRDRKGLGFLRKALAEEPNDPELLAMGLFPARNTGASDDLDAWSARWLSVAPKDRRAVLARADALRRRGRLDEATALLTDWVKAESGAIDYGAVGTLAAIAEARGRRDEAEAHYDRLVQDAKARVVRDVEGLVALADAYRFFRGLREAEKVLAEAQALAARSKPIDPAPSIALGRLYLDHFYLPGDAAAEFKAALDARPYHADALWGQVRAYQAWQQGAPAAAAKATLATLNPNYPEALVAAAASSLGDMDLDGALESLDQVLAQNPRDRDALALLSLRHRFAGDAASAQETWDRLLAADPTYGAAHLLVAGVLNERRRWAEAVESCRQAVRLSPDDPEAYDALARYAFFLGLDDEGMEALRQADARDRFSHPWRTNMFEVRRVLKEFYVEFETEHFVHRVHRKELAAFRPVLETFCRDSWDLLTKKYRYQPTGLALKPGKVLVEWFRDHGDFSVRTLGFTHLGATGVCFGPFIGMNSPGAQERGTYSWARTFHHELAHTMTVGLSRGRTPRWLTEGLSTYEEVAYDGSWSRGMHRDLVDALANDDFGKVLTFDQMFSTPRIGFAYFQAGLECEWMVERFGIDKVREVLVAFGEDRTTGEILRDVLGTTGDAFDDGFRTWMSARMAEVRLEPRPSAARVRELMDRLEKNPTDGEARTLLAVARVEEGRALDAQELIYVARQQGSVDPRLDWLLGRLAKASGSLDTAKEHFEAALAKGYENHDIRMDLGDWAEKAGDAAEAKRQFLKAVETFPMRGGPDGPRMRLARLALAAQDEDEVVEWMEAHLERTYEDIPTRKRLLSIYEADGDRAAIRRHLVALLRIDPLDQTWHEMMADLEFAEGRGAAAARAIDTLLALHLNKPEGDRSPADEAALRVRLGRAHLLEEGKMDDAEAQARRALELVPGDAGAQELLRDIDAKRRAGGRR